MYETSLAYLSRFQKTKNESYEVSVYFIKVLVATISDQFFSD